MKEDKLLGAEMAGVRCGMWSGLELGATPFWLPIIGDPFPVSKQINYYRTKYIR